VEQKIDPLSEDDVQHAEKQRNWVRGHYVVESQHKYETIDGKLTLIQRILDAGWIEPTETWKLQSLGITFGDALKQRIGMEWVAVEDEFGRTPSLQLPGSSVILFPLTTISKRIERGESVNVQELFDWFCESVEQKRSLGY
jgi:Domain of unknown function (DUF3806)